MSWLILTEAAHDYQEFGKKLAFEAKPDWIISCRICFDLKRICTPCMNYVSHTIMIFYYSFFDIVLFFLHFSMPVICTWFYPHERENTYWLAQQKLAQQNDWWCLGFHYTVIW